MKENRNLNNCAEAEKVRIEANIFNCKHIFIHTPAQLFQSLHQKHVAANQNLSWEIIVVFFLTDPSLHIEHNFHSSILSKYISKIIQTFISTSAIPQ